eukprot:4561626-Prymnesium_polylepis.1
MFLSHAKSGPHTDSSSPDAQKIFKSSRRRSGCAYGTRARRRLFRRRTEPARDPPTCAHRHEGFRAAEHATQRVRVNMPHTAHSRGRCRCGAGDGSSERHGLHGKARGAGIVWGGESIAFSQKFHKLALKKRA